MAENPFYVAPPSTLEALALGQQSFTASRKARKEEELDGLYKATGARIANGGLDNAALGQIIGMGPSAAPLLTAVGSIGKSDKTDTLKNLAVENASRAAKGLPPLSPLEYQTTLSNAGASKSIVNMPPQEKAYDQAMGKELADQNIGIMKGASSARSNLANIDRLEQLLSDPSVYQGMAGEKVLQAKKIAKTLGIDVDGVGDAEAAQSISNQLALQARNPAGGAGMPGSMSDSDRVFLRDIQPGIEKTPEGNRLIIDIYRKLNQRAIDVEQLRQNYIRKNGRLNEGFYSALNEYSNSNPLFANYAKPAAPQANAQPPVKDARQAPDGNWYIQRNGKTYRVDQ